MIRVLIVDDEQELLKILGKKLQKEGMEVFTASNGKDALSLIKGMTLDIGLFDLKLPDIDGVRLLGKMKEMQPTAEVIMLTGHGTVDSAIQSMKLGAYDYLTKPCKLYELHNIILKAYEKKQLKEQNIALEGQLRAFDVHDSFIGESEAIRNIKKSASLVATSDVPVLVLGETGTGKGVVARNIHDLSKRSTHPFITINAGSLQDNILESELFGYRKGAFTGADSDKTGLLEIANKGTFFLDEVADMGATIQGKLLRVLEERVFRKLGDTKEITVDIRFLFATNKNIEEEVASKRFREDLFYRLNTFAISVPPLRDRKTDIPLLANYFISKHFRGSPAKTVARDAMDALVSYSWPGNVRELANVIERALLISTHKNQITIDSLPGRMAGSGESETAGKKSRWSPESDLSLRAVEKEHIARVLKFTGGNKSKASRLLGISRKNLYQKIEEYWP